jgi:hypothetical protein
MFRTYRIFQRIAVTSLGVLGVFVALGLLTYYHG